MERSIFIGAVIAVVLMVCWVGYADYEQDHSPEYNYINKQFRIVAVQSPEYWKHGKFSGVDKRWLIQDLSDSNMLAEYVIELPDHEGNHIGESEYFSYNAGDTFLFAKIRKDRFFFVRNPHLVPPTATIKPIQK
jgi:hypothetical protein